MIQQPEISVLLPVYNSEKYVFEAVQSILQQSYSDFELIILNDGSQDDSEKIIRSFTDQRIQYIRNEKNIGLIATLNNGLKIAKGAFIARMDADDIALPNRLEQQVHFLRNNPDVGMCGTHFIPFGKNNASAPVLPHLNDEVRMTLIFRSAMAHPSVMMRKGLIDEFNLSYHVDYPAAEDYKLWTDFALHGKMVNLKEVLLKYRVHENQITQTKVEQKETSLKKIHADFFNALGVSATDEEFGLHYRLSGGRGARNVHELHQTLNWLNKLRDQLIQIQFAAHGAIEKQLSLEFKKACENSGLGLIALKTWNACYWKTPFASLEDSASFYFKIFTRYKAH